MTARSAVDKLPALGSGALYRQLELWANGGPAPADLENVDVSFLHQSMCIAGLPLRKPADARKPFHRADGQFAYTVTPQTSFLPDGTELTVGVPYGAKARLLSFWLATQAKEPTRAAGDRWITIGRIKPWLSAIGIRSSGRSKGALSAYEGTKDQLIRLAFANFTAYLKHQDQYLMNKVTMIDAGVFAAADLAAYAAGRLGDVGWPEAIQLTREAYERFQRQSVAIPTQRIAKVAHNAMAIDILVFLAYNLPRIAPNQEELVTWKALIAQFGNKEAPSEFQRRFAVSIRGALDAYPEANVRFTKEGLRIRYSDPARLERAFMALPGGAMPGPSTKA